MFGPCLQVWLRPTHSSTLLESLTVRSNQPYVLSCARTDTFLGQLAVFAHHLTDVAYMSTSFHTPIVAVGFYVSVCLILCCQTFLLRRSFLFGQTFHLGNSKWRLVYLSLIACLVVVGACMGFVAQKELMDFKTLDDVIQHTGGFQLGSL